MAKTKSKKQQQQIQSNTSTLNQIILSRIKIKENKTLEENLPKNIRNNIIIRIEFIKSLERLGYCINSTFKEVNKAETISKSISNIEDEINLVKEYAYTYQYDVLYNERKQLLFIQKQFQAMWVTNDDYLIISKTMIIQQYLKQLQIEQTRICNDILSTSKNCVFNDVYNSIERLLALDDTNTVGKEYEDSANDNSSGIFFEWSNIIRNCTFIDPLLLLQYKQKKSNDTIRPSYYKNPNDADNDTIILSSSLEKLKLSPETNDDFLFNSNTIQQLLHSFYNLPLQNNQKTKFVLLIGTSRYGKTHFCNSIQNPKIEIIKPNIALDVISNRIGQSESLLISYFYYAFKISIDKKCILILDDLEYILGATSSHWGVRMRTTFFRLMDTLENSNNHLLVIGTCATNTISDDIQSRFHKAYTLGLPNDIEREEIIRSSLLFSNQENDEIKALVSSLVNMSMGRSASEISYCCRQTILSLSCNTIGSTTIQDKDRLIAVKEYLQSTPSESIQSKSLDQFASVRIYTYKDFSIEESVENFPLIGINAKGAWNTMKNFIITPLCQSNDLDNLLNCNTKSKKKKSVCGGVLLAGPPASGKSILSYYCAKYAITKLLPTLKLLVVSCTSIIHKELGKSEQTISRIFTAARKSNTPCIILLENIDVISSPRGNDTTSEGTMDRILSTLLMEMDGIEDEDTESNIAVIGTTHDIKWIDNALKRPGRLDQIIHLNHPTQSIDDRMIIIRNELESILKIVPISYDCDDYFLPKNKEDLIRYIAMHTSKEQSFLDIVSVCKNAVTCAIRSYCNELNNDKKSSEKENFVGSYTATGSLFNNEDIVLKPMHFRQALKI